MRDRVVRTRSGSYYMIGAPVSKYVNERSKNIKEKAIQRGKRYAGAGADMIFVEAPQSVDEIRKIANSISTPLLINMFKGGKTPLVPMKELEAMGYRVAIVPSPLQLAAMHAMKELLQVLKREGTIESFSERMVSFRERDEIVDLPKYEKLEKEFLE